MHLLKASTPVLLTGATGLIGGELLSALLGSGSHLVTSLVRAKAGTDPRLRLAERLKRSRCDSLWLEDDLRIATGDLSSPGLGLQPEVSAQLQGETEIILHSASETSFLRVRDCHRTNIEGTRNLIEFAKGCRRRPLIVYMSTAANSGAVTHRCLREEEGCQPDRKHHNEYTQSKAVAERMLEESGLPLLVLRPSIVFSAGMGDLGFARAIVWFLPLLNHFDAVPIDPASRLDCVPVSFVVDTTLALLRQPSRRYKCYHLSAGPESAGTCGDVADFLNDFFGREVPFNLIPPAEWTREMHRRYVRVPEQRKIFSMVAPYLPFMNMDVVYDNARLIEEFGEDAVRVPPFVSYLGDLLSLMPQRSNLAALLNS